MSGYRSGRINEEVKRELANVLREIKDPRVPEFVSVIGVSVTPDLKFAKVRVSIMGNPEQVKEGIKGMGAASGYIRRALAARLKLRYTPELHFEADDSIAHGAHIAQLLRDVLPQEDDTGTKEE